MLSFVNDYSEGAHPLILDRLVQTNFEKAFGYGEDQFCESARRKIRYACDDATADVFFLAGGTQTNQIIIDTMLGSYEGVVAVETGHVSTHEAGAIEYSGHKVLTLPHYDGKMRASDLSQYLADFYADGNHDHMVFPGMVYISQPTEYGTLYSKDELVGLCEVCAEYDIPLFLDGARLGYALATPSNDVSLEDIALLTDAFYIGGTKVGSLLGEAVVFPNEGAPKHFITQVKQHGALLAKSRVLGIQFDELFADGLYERIAANAIRLADKLRTAFAEKGYTFFIDSPTNQIFIVLENVQMDELKEKVAFSFWEKVDEEHTAVRFATSWATTEEEVDALIALL